MTKIFIKSGTNVRVADNADIETYDNLPAETYTVKFNEQADEFFLEQIENFDLPSKIYGTNTNYAERILNTFAARSGATGVILSGIKGAGKTLLAKQTAVAARENGIPTIVINKDWHGDKFNSFIQSITTPSIIMFDEFEKVYDYHKQRKILTLLDGVYNSRKLFMLTTNTEDDVSEFLQNRPGRIFYNFTFDVLEADFIQEFLDDRLDDKSQITSILDYAKVFSFFNFDMLSAIAEEMNRYGETLVEVLSVLNVKPENRRSDTYKIEAIIGGDTIVLDQNYNNFKPNSFSYMLWTDDDMPAGIKKNETAKKLVTQMTENAGEGDDYLNFTAALINRFEADSSRFVYSLSRNDESIELHVTRNDPLAKWKFNPNANAL
jgi:hypothetical protein